MTVARQQRQSRPHWTVILLSGALLLLLIVLGIWQLERAAEKTAIFDSFESRELAPVNASDVDDANDDRYRPVIATGRFLPQRQFLIDNIVELGRNGFYVLTPFELRGSSRYLLVNRGWVAQDPARRELPDIDVGSDTRDIAGLVGRLPVAGLKLDGGVSRRDIWPSIRQFPDIPELEQALGEPLADWVLLLDEAEPDGYRRVWAPRGFGPERHIGYAVQWFALALTLIVILIVVNTKRV